MQYQFTFNIGKVKYVLVATRYAQAARHFKKFYTGGYTVTSNGRYQGPAVTSGKCVAVYRSH
jgi:hypothetical protein